MPTGARDRLLFGEQPSRAASRRDLPVYQIGKVYSILRAIVTDPGLLFLKTAVKKSDTAGVKRDLCEFCVVNDGVEKGVNLDKRSSR